MLLLKVLLHAVDEVSLLPGSCAAMGSEEIFQHGHGELFTRSLANLSMELL